MIANGRHRIRVVWRLIVVLAFAVTARFSEAQPQAPVYDECRLDSIFPNGGRRGTTVQVEFRGYGSGLTGPLQVLIDGPPGVTVKELKSINAGVAHGGSGVAEEG